MTVALQPQLAAHLERHARKLYAIACGFGRQRDADDILQTLYTRWWRRMMEEPDWSPPESNVELWVCVRRVVMDVAAKERRDRARDGREATEAWGEEGIHRSASPEDSLYAFERLRWIMSRLPPPLRQALKATLAAGRNDDEAVAKELGLTHAAFTARLFRARRAAEELASYYEILSRDEANVMVELRYSGKSRVQIAHDLGMMVDELTRISERALEQLQKKRRVAS